MEAMIWIGLIILFVVVEIATVGLTSIWFAGGALISLILCLCGVGLGWQIGVFFVVSLILVAFTRPWAVKYLKPHLIRLNQRITFLESRVVTDAIGNHTAVWDEAFSCWARATLKSSVENTEAGVTKETQTLEFLIRQSQHWMPSVTGNRILFQGNIYDITGITPDYLHKDYLKLTAEARKAGQNDQY